VFSEASRAASSSFFATLRLLWATFLGIGIWLLAETGRKDVRIPRDLFVFLSF
jgi:hypothetical protein